MITRRVNTAALQRAVGWRHWMKPAAPDSRDVEFETTTLPSAWSLFNGGGSNVNSITPYAAPGATNNLQYDVGIKPSHIRLQPGSVGTYMGIHRAVTVGTNLWMWAGLTANRRNTAHTEVANDCGIALWLTVASGGVPDQSNWLGIFVNENDANACSGKFVKAIGGVFTSHGATGNVDGFASPMYGVGLHKVGSNYNAWVLSDGGWTYIGTTTWAGGTFDRCVVAAINTTSTVPANMIMSCDFVRFEDTDSPPGL